MTARVSVLIVDDQAIFRRAAAALVRSTKELELVGEAASAEAALVAVREEQPEFVLMDVRLPGMSGIQVTRAILRACPGTRVLLVSTHERADLPLDLDDCGAIGFARKQDLTSQLLLHVIRLDRTAPSSVRRPGHAALDVQAADGIEHGQYPPAGV